MSFLRCTNFRLYFFICSVTPCLNQVFRRCFSMENLRAYAEDEAPASSVQPPVTKGPNTSEGLSTSSSTSASVPSTRTLSGPVQEVSTPLQSSSVVSRDKTVSLKDIPPPPPPDEPYELFLARVACQTLDPAGGTPRPAAAEPVPPPLPLTTVGLRLPTPFPRFEDTSWASIPQVQGPRIRMPLPASCYVPPPQPWTWSGRGPDVPSLQVRSQAPLLSSMGPVRFPGPSTLAGGPPTEGPLPHLLPPTSSSVSKNAASPPPRFRGFFLGATPPFVQKEATTSVTTAALQLNPQTDENVYPGPPPAVVQDWKAQMFEDMRLYWKQLQGDAPPQSTVGSAVPQGNMGPDTLRQLSPSGDREASRAQHKSGSKRAGSISRRRSHSRERSSGDRARRRDRRSRTSQDSSPSRRRSTAARRSCLARAGSNDSCSSEGRPRSQRSPRPWTSCPRGFSDATHLLLRHLHVGTGVARLPLVGPSGPARLRGLLGDPPLRHTGDLPLIIASPVIHHGIPPRLIRLVFVDVIISPLHILGRLHPKGLGPGVCPILATTLDLSAESVANIPLTRTSVSCVCGRTLKMTVTFPVLIPVVLLNQNSLL